MIRSKCWPKACTGMECQSWMAPGSSKITTRLLSGTAWGGTHGGEYARRLAPARGERGRGGSLLNSDIYARGGQHSLTA